jgi:hypothetical protein
VVTTAAVCAGAAVLVAGLGTALGYWRVAVALALGLAVGPVNGLLARGALGVDLAFGATSMMRLLLLSAVALGLGAGLLGLQMVAFVLLGIGAAQLVLAVVAGLSVVRA